MSPIDNNFVPPPPPPPPPKPKPKTDELAHRPPAPQAAQTGRLAQDNQRMAGASGSSRLSLGGPGATAPLRGAGAAPTPAPAADGGKQVQAEMAKLQGQLKDLKKPEELHDLAARAHDLAARAEESGAGTRPAAEAAAFAAQLDKADQAVQKLHTLDAQLNGGSAQDKAVATAQALANPSDFKQAIGDLKAIAGSPLLEKQKANVDDITKHADAGSLGQALAKDPDLSHYPPEMAANLGKLRQVPDPALQKGLDEVGKGLLAQSAAAQAVGLNPDQTPTDPLSLAAVRENPSLGQLVAPLAESKDPGTASAAKDVVQRLASATLRDNVDKGGPDAMTNFADEIKSLGDKSGLGKAMSATLPDAAQSVAQDYLNKGVSYDQVKANPAIGQVLSTLQTSKDPAVTQKLGDTVRGWMHAGLNNALKANDVAGDPQANAQKTMQDFMADAQGLAQATGLGAVMQQQMPEAQKNVAVDIAKNSAIKVQDIKQNPAYGALVASLNADPATKGLADAKVKALTEASVDAHLEGKKGEDGVKDAMSGVKDDLTTLAKAGLGENVKSAAEDAIKGKQGKIEDTVNAGKSWWDKVTGAIGDVIGDVGHFVGGIVSGIGDIAGGALKGIGLDGVGDAVKGFAHGAGDSLDQTIAMTGQMVLHPWNTAKAFGHMLLHPIDTVTTMAKQMWADASKGGIAHALGYGAMTAFTTFGGAGAVGNLAERGLTSLAASSVPKIAEIGNIGLRGLQGLQSLATSAKEMASTVGEAGMSVLGGHLGISALTNIGTISEMSDIAGKGLEKIKDGIQSVRTNGLADAVIDAGVHSRQAVSGATRDVVDGLRTLRHPVDLVKGIAHDVKPTIQNAWQELRHGNDPLKLRVQQSVADLRPALDRLKQEALFKPIAVGAKIGSGIGTLVAMPGMFLGRAGQSLLGEVAGQGSVSLVKRGFYAQRQQQQRERMATLEQLGLSSDEAKVAAGEA